jgi:nucleoside-diphosphate-sugar epimerase
MRVVVTGATGNVGTSVVRALGESPEVDEIVGMARRLPAWVAPKTTWVRADVASSELVSSFRGAGVVVHLAWLIQPSHDERVLRRTNVDGTARVLTAVVAADVPRLVYASSVGAYSPGPKDRRVDESWPTDGIPTSTYSRHKARVERMLDRFAAEHPRVRVARLRPGLIFKRAAASEIRRLFLGPFFPNVLLRTGRVPLVPDWRALRFQAVHSFDVGDAYRRAALSDVTGAFNIAAEPVLEPAVLAKALHAYRMPVYPPLLRALTAASWHLHLQPTDAGWFDMATRVPLMDTRRAARELGWRARVSAVDALQELIAGIGNGEGFPTPPLAPGGDGPFRVYEITSGVGSRAAA